MRAVILLLLAFSATAVNATAEQDYQRCLAKLDAYQELIDIRMDYQTGKCHYFHMPCKWADRNTTITYPEGAYDSATVYLQDKYRGVAEYCMDLLDEIENSTN
jgi:hypothetical protein